METTQAAVYNFVRLHRSRMRVEQERAVDIFSDNPQWKEFQSIPDGTFDNVEMLSDGKTYKYQKAGTNACYITRKS